MKARLCFVATTISIQTVNVAQALLDPRFGAPGKIGTGSRQEALPGKSVPGEVAVPGAPALELEWKDERFRQKPVVIADRQKQWFGGLLSVRALGFRNIALDAENQRVCLHR